MGANSSRRHFLHGIGMGVATLAMTGCADTVKHPALEAAVIVFSDNVAAIIDVFDYVTTNDILFDAPAGNTLPVQDKMTTAGLERDNIIEAVVNPHLNLEPNRHLCCLCGRPASVGPETFPEHGLE